MQENCALQDTTGRPISEDFIIYIEGNIILNFSIMRQGILQAEEIFRPNSGSLKGNTTR